MTLFLSFIAFS